MEGDVITMQEIFRFKKVGRGDDGGVIGSFEATGIRPKFMDVLAAHGQNLPSDIFRPDRKIGQ
jgi:pilus assembly protein CpaF